jgi:hypothetical protein
MDQPQDRQPPAKKDEAPEQTWGQGEGEHEPTIPDDAEAGTEPVTYTGGTAATLDDPDALAREDEGMDR